MNMKKMMQQAQKLQKEMTEAQEELNGRIFEGTAGGGSVKVTMSGEKKVLEIILQPEIVDPEDVELLQDLIVVATNETIKKVEEETDNVMGKFSKGLNFPGF